MSTESSPDRLSSALDRVLAGSRSELAEGDDLFELLGTAAFLRESLTSVPAPEPFRTSLREWIQTEPARRWWEDLMGPVRQHLPLAQRQPAVGVAMGAGAAAAAIVIGVLVIRRRRASVHGIAGSIEVRNE